MQEKESWKKDMRRTNRRVYLYCPDMGWYRGFNRRIYEDEDGYEYVDMRGMTPLNWVIGRADWFGYETDAPY